MRLERRTVDLDSGCRPPRVPARAAELVRRRLRATAPVEQARLDLAFADDFVSFSFDVLALRLERLTVRRARRRPKPAGQPRNAPSSAANFALGIAPTTRCLTSPPSKASTVGMFMTP